MSTQSKIKGTLKAWLTYLLMQGVVAVFISGVVINLTAVTSAAQDAESRQFGAKAGQIVNNALKLVKDEQHVAAIAELSKALAMPDLNAYERSTIYQMRGMEYYETKQMAASIADLESAISAGGFLPKDISALRVNIAQLYISEGQFARGAQMLENWANSGGQLKPAHIELLYQAWVEAENFNRALPWAEKWFSAANPKERKHFDVMNYLFNSLGMKGRQSDIVKQMIVRWPEDETLWNTWLSMLANGDREAEAFEVSKMLYLGGAYTKEQDILRVVQYYGVYEMPYQAAQILEREMNAGRIQKNQINLESLSNMWRQAREYERAIPVLAEAARLTGKAKIYGEWGEALFRQQECVKAEDVLQEAMKKGFSKGKAWGFIANCRYNRASAAPRLSCKWSNEKINGSARVKYWNNAIAAFDNVPNGAHKKDANNWTKFIRGERKGFDARCEFERGVREDVCMASIELEYNEMFMTGEFELDDKTCMKFKPKYDKLYRKGSTTKGDG
ncbi:MAG: hypothetical protein V3U57_04055 [Robiginitomaculum sp.]